MYLYGAGGHARVIVDCMESLNIPVDGIVEPNTVLRDWKGYRMFNSPPVDAGNEKWVIAIGSNILRKRVAEKFGYLYGTVWHRSAIIARDALLGDGSVIFHRVILQPGVVLGKHVVINTSASVDHDCHISDFAHISPNATLCGNVTVGEGSQVGANATVIPGVTIGRWCMIGAGAVVIKDVPDFAVVVGNPGKIIKYQKIELT